MTKSRFSETATICSVDNEIHFVPDRHHSRPTAQSILAGKHHEPETHKFIRAAQKWRPGDIIHAGTFFGDMLPSFSKIAGQHNLYAFEPAIDNYIWAHKTVQENNLNNVALFNAALGTECRHITRVKTHNANRPLGGLARVDPRGNQITTQMDIDMFRLNCVSAIHLDVEGTEFDVLCGATRTIFKNQPVILIEDNNSRCGSILTSWNYVMVAETPHIRMWAPQSAATYFALFAK